MKIDHLFYNSIACLLALAGTLSGCVNEELEASRTVPLSISATCPVLSGNNGTRAAVNAEVKIALNTTGGGYASVAKTYQVTSTAPITFESANPFEIEYNKTSTPLTIYGWLDENTPVSYSNSNVTVSGGKISGIKLSPAYACVGVRILMDGKTETANRYTISSSLKGIGTATNNNNWTTSGTIPMLNAYNNSPADINNTDKTTVVGISASELTANYFMKVAPATILSGTTNLFTITLPNRTSLPVPVGNNIEIKSGYCYLFTINISRETSLKVSSIEQMEMDKNINIPVQSPDNRRPGIYTEQDLDDFLAALDKGESTHTWVSSDNTINLYTDIDLKYEPWLPLGLGNSKFNFKGNGFTISNLYINAPSFIDGYGAGFYTIVDKDITVQGLTIDGVMIDYRESGANDMNCGAIAGTLEGSIIDCHVTGKVILRSQRYNVGGIVGEVYGGKVHACTVAPGPSSVILGQNTGGIVGRSEREEIVGCIVHDIHFSADRDISIEAIGGIVPSSDRAVYCNIVYNLTAAESLNKSRFYPISDNINLANDNCYYYNVFNESAGTRPVSSLEDLSREDIMGMLNSDLRSTNFLFHYEPSPTPTETGPTIKPGKPQF